MKPVEAEKVGVFEKGEQKEFDLTELDGVGPKTAIVLKEAGYDTVEKIKSITMEDLTKLEGIGTKTAEKILGAAKAL